MQSKQLQHQSLFYLTVATAIYYIETMNHHVNVKPNKKVLIMEWKQEYTIKDMNISVFPLEEIVGYVLQKTSQKCQTISRSKFY
jgi:hypothetical protein